MAAWIMRGKRLDVELAVALEVGALELTRSGAKALDFNRTLWRCIGRLAATASDLGERDALLAEAETLSRATDPALVARRNGAHARTLAAKAATQGALKRLIEDWRTHRNRNPQAEFGQWLLSRLDDHGAPVSMAA